MRLTWFVILSLAALSCGSSEQAFGGFFHLILRVIGLRSSAPSRQRISQDSTLPDSWDFVDDWALGDLKDYQLPDPEDVKRHFDLKDTAEMRQAVNRLSQSLVGTRGEKQKIAQYCSKQSLNFDQNSPQTISCLAHIIEKNKKDKPRAQRGSNRSVKAFDWSNLSGAALRTSLNALPIRNLTQLARMEKAALAIKESDHPKYARAVVALILKSENFLPEKQAALTSDRIYQAYRASFSEVPDVEEKVHIRMGTLYLYYAKLFDDMEYFQKSVDAFLFALNSFQKTESFRALFWLGYLHGVNAPQTGYFFPKNRYWTRLISEHPFSFHTMIAMNLLKEDYFETILKQGSPLTVSPFVGSNISDHVDNLINYTALILHAFQQKRAITEFERIALRVNTGQQLPNTLFLACFFNHYQRLRVSLRLFDRSIQEYGISILNEALLEKMHPYHYLDLVSEKASGFRKYLVLSLIKQESSFDPRAVSLAGARGVMQVIPSTARNLAGRRSINLHDPRTSIDLGTLYLDQRLRNLNGNYLKATGAYNAGILKVRAWEKRFSKTKFNTLYGDLVPYPETRDYGPKIFIGAIFYSHFIGKEGSKNLDYIADFMMQGHDLPLPATPTLRLDGPFDRES
jgi:soluble lytic murein transglycosylase